MNCRESILYNLKGEMTTYEIHKKIGFSYSTTHRYVKELFLEGKLIKTKTDTSNPIRTWYKVVV